MLKHKATSKTNFLKNTFLSDFLINYSFLGSFRIKARTIYLLCDFDDVSCFEIQLVFILRMIIELHFAQSLLGLCRKEKLLSVGILSFALRSSNNCLKKGLLFVFSKRKKDENQTFMSNHTHDVYQKTSRITKTFKKMLEKVSYIFVNTFRKSCNIKIF